MSGDRLDVEGGEDIFRDSVCDQCEVKHLLWSDRLPKPDKNVLAS